MSREIHTNRVHQLKTVNHRDRVKHLNSVRHLNRVNRRKRVSHLNRTPQPTPCVGSPRPPHGDGDDGADDVDGGGDGNLDDVSGVDSDYVGRFWW